MFHMLAYTGSLGVNANNTDLTAASDPEFTQRNGHYTFSELYELLAGYYFATSATRANMLAPTWNAFTKFNIWPVNRNANTPSNPQIDPWVRMPPKMPVQEEFQVQGSNNLGAATEQSTAFLWIAPPSWNQNLPTGKDPMPIMEIRANFTTATITANSWSGLGALTLEQGLRSGTYALVGLQVQGAAIQGVRVVFPRAPMAYNNRRMRPGTIVNQAIGDVPLDFTPYAQFLWGEWGRFNTFELPQVEWWSSAGGAIAVEMRLWLVWLSTSMDVTYGAAA